MREFTVYHMRRHIPPMGSVHVTAAPLGSVQAASAVAALLLAKQKHAPLLPHIAIGEPEDAIHELTKKTIARANRSIYA